MRRRVFLGMVAGSSISVTGCNDSSSTTPTPASDHAAAEGKTASEYLTTIFQRLTTVDITTLRTLTIGRLRKINFELLGQELDGARISFAELKDLESTPSETQQLVAYGIQLATPRVIIYRQLERLLVQQRPLQTAADQQNYSRAETLATNITDVVTTIADSTATLTQFVTDGPDGLSTDAVPTRYQLTSTRQEATRLTEELSTLQPATEAVVA